MAIILITGGTGLIGTELSKKLADLGYEVWHLSTSGSKYSVYPTYKWNPYAGTIDSEAIAGADYIIHLAGANIGQKRWTPARKQLIVDSRVKSGELLFKTWQQHPGKLKAFISASATGYYGATTSETIFAESDTCSGDFLGQTCLQWENTASLFAQAGIRTVILRTGVVLSPKGGALQQLMMPAKAGIGVALGNGRQYMPWIHLDDLCEMYVKALADVKMNGSYNAVAPQHVSNLELTRSLAHALNLPFGVIKAPAFAIRLAMGEMSCVVLEGSRVSSAKIEKAGFRFRYPEIHTVLEAVLLRQTKM